MALSSSEKSPVVIDGANVAYAYGNGCQFQVRGILLAVAYFQRLRHNVTVILSWKYKFKCEQDDDETGQVLRQLQKDNILSFAPSGSNDDDFVIQRAVKTRSFILSCDKYEDEKQKHPEWRSYVENYRLNFTFLNGDDFTPNPTPLGPDGPTLKQFLNRRPPILTGEVSVLDAVSKSNQQLLNEIIRVSRLHVADIGAGSSGKFKKGREKTKEEARSFVTRNPFQLLSSNADRVDQSINETDAADDQSDKSSALSPVVDGTSMQVNSDGACTSDCTPEIIDPTEKSAFPISSSHKKDETKQKKASSPSGAADESPFQTIITGYGTVTHSDDKRGLIRVDENFSAHPCKFVEFYPYACLGTVLEGKLLSDKMTMNMVDAVELMSRYPVGTEVGFVAAFIDGFNCDQDTASALQVCAKSSLLDGFGHCEVESIFTDHAFVVSKSGQLHWSPCCESSLLLFRNAFGENVKERNLNKFLTSHDWLAYKSMPTPAVALFDLFPIVVRVAFLELTGLVVRLTNDYGVIRSARVNDNIAFRNVGIFSEKPSLDQGAGANEIRKKRQLKIGDWVQFRIRRHETATDTANGQTKRNVNWKAVNVHIIDKPPCVSGDAAQVECVDKIDNFRQKKKKSNSDYALKISAFGFTGTIKPHRGVLWCHAIGRVNIDPSVLIDINISDYPVGTLVEFDAMNRPHEKSHERKDTVWCATALRKLTKKEQTRFKNSDTAFSTGLYHGETAMVDCYDNERRWAGLHGRESRYILYDRYDDVAGRDDGKLKSGETVKVTYVDPPIDSPLYIAIAVEATE